MVLSYVSSELSGGLLALLIPILAHALQRDLTTLQKTSSYSFVNETNANITLLSGTTAHISCPLTDVDNNSISWWREGDLLARGLAVLSSDSRMSVEDNTTLHIREVSSKDSGYYRCSSPDEAWEIILDVRDDWLNDTRQRPRRSSNSDISPYFDNTTSLNVTTTSGTTAFLPCRVKHLGDRTVSWIRKKDLHVLTVGKFTYTNDQRFQTLHPDNSDNWTLQVKYTQHRDAGLYECQVSTVPKMSHFVNLNVIVSKAEIQGGPTLYINSGSTLTLTCEVVGGPEPPVYVFWYHEGQAINYGTSRGVLAAVDRGPLTTSRLTVPAASPGDSGTYSCVPSNAEPADITVHVLNGENPAAMQHGKHPSSSHSIHPVILLVGPCLVVLWINKR